MWRGLTLIEKLLFHAWFQRPAEGALADEFKVICHFVHLFSFQIGDYDEDVVASMIVHSPQKHQFWKLRVGHSLSGA